MQLNITLQCLHSLIYTFLQRLAGRSTISSNNSRESLTAFNWFPDPSISLYKYCNPIMRHNYCIIWLHHKQTARKSFMFLQLQWSCSYSKRSRKLGQQMVANCPNQRPPIVLIILIVWGARSYLLTSNCLVPCKLFIVIT